MLLLHREMLSRVVFAALNTSLADGIQQRSRSLWIGQLRKRTVNSGSRVIQDYADVLGQLGGRFYLHMLRREMLR